MDDQQENNGNVSPLVNEFSTQANAEANNSEHGQEIGSQEPENQVSGPQKSGKMSNGTKVLIGCGCGCFGFIALIVVACICGWLYVKGLVDKEVAALEEKGFKNRGFQQMTVERKPVPDKTMFVGQIVKISGGAEGDLGIISQIAVIEGEVKGKIYFRGQILNIMPDAVVHGGVDMKGQVINVQGTVNGEITGTYQTKTNQPMPMNF